MPIQIETTVDVSAVEAKLKVFEGRHHMSSETFAADPSFSRTISEDDAIEWDFLIMQKIALQDDCCAKAIYRHEFSAPCRSDLETQDPTYVYEQVAA